MTSLFYYIRQVAACVAKLVIRGALGTPTLGEGEVLVAIVGQRWYHSNERWVISYRLSISAISNHSAAIYHRMSPTFKSTGCRVNLGQNLGRKEVDRQSLGQTRGCRMQQNRVDNFCRLSAMHERDRQTNRQSDHGTPIAIGEIACQRCRLIITIAMRVSALLQFDGIFTNVAVNFTICYKKARCFVYSVNQM